MHFAFGSATGRRGFLSQSARLCTTGSIVVGLTASACTKQDAAIEGTQRTLTERERPSTAETESETHRTPPGASGSAGPSENETEPSTEGPTSTTAIDTTTLPRLLRGRGFSAPDGFKARIVRLEHNAPAAVFDWNDSAHHRENWWPASTVKLFAAVSALERVATLGMSVRSRVTFHYEEEDEEPATVRLDHLVELAIGRSDNVAFDRLVELAGYDRIHQNFLTEENGAPSTVLLRCYGQRQRDDEAGVCTARSAPRITLQHGERREELAAGERTGSYACPNEGNCTTLADLSEVMRRVMRHEQLPEEERYALREEDLETLRRAMSHAKNYRLAEIFEEACDGQFSVWHKPGYALRWVSDVLFLRHGDGQEWVVSMAGRPGRRALDDAAAQIGRLLCEDALAPSASPAQDERAETQEAAGSASSSDSPGPVIADPSGQALAPFHAALNELEAGERVVRVSHFGDSSIGRDELPHALRTRFQERFGDAGPGFVLLQPHSASYRNQAVRFSQPVPWDFCFITFRCKPDGHYGLGGVVAESQGRATTVFRLPEPPGDAQGLFELWYAGIPRGGRLEISVAGRERVVLETAAEHLTDRFYATHLAPDARQIRIRALGRGVVRAYGAVIENGQSGVVWDTHSMIGAFTRRLLAQDPSHLEGQLQRRRSDLMIFSYGGNDLRRLVGGVVSGPELQAETESVIERFRTARPEAGCVFVGTIEHRRSGPVAVSAEDVATVVDSQKSAAFDSGCAFFDTFRAMGGPGSYENWRRQGLAAEDGKHLTRRGRDRVAGFLYSALLRGRET